MFQPCFDRILICLIRSLICYTAFVDDSCVCCGRMSMISLRSRLSFMKGLAPSAATRADLSGSSRGSPADALGDLRVTVRASPPGMPPRTSYSSRSEHPVRFPGDFAGLSHGAPSISFGAPSVDRMSIAVHIPGQLNRAANALSRQFTFPGEWRLHPETIRLIWSRFGEA